MKKIILLSIIAISAIIRLYNFGNVPPSLNWDEVSLGYNAYSITQTGKDEYGAHLPLVLRSFDDYKPALYAYLIIPLLPLFDLSAVSVRLPSALAGIGTVILTYFLVKELFKQITFKQKKISEHLALASSFFVAISPWSIQFSRQAFESNVGVFLNTASALLFLKSFDKKYLLPISFAVGAANIHMYQSNRVFTPLMLIALTVIFRKKLLKMKKWFLVSACAAIVVTAPFIHYTFTNQDALLRARGVSVFADQTNLLKTNAEKLLVENQNSNSIGAAINNRRVEYTKLVVSGYIAHFNLNWLFISGDIARHHAPNMGLMYIVTFPFLFIGLYQLIFNKSISKHSRQTYFAYLLLVPVPAMITTGVPHAVRTLNFIPLLQIAVACGAVFSFFYVKELYNSKKIYQKIIVLFSTATFASLAILNMLYFLNQYFVQQNYFHSKAWLYGYEQTVDYIEPISKNYDEIVVSNQAPLDQSYMFFLFYTKFDPKKYQELGGTLSGGFREDHKGFNNYSFRPIDFNNEKSGTLIVARPKDIPEDAKVLKKISYLNGEEAIYIVEK